MKEVRGIYGIDFSGAKDAGKKMWISRGVPHGDKLLIQTCFRVMDLTGGVVDLNTCLPALVKLVQPAGNAAFGFDFPFGLPRSLVNEESWEEFVLRFPTRFHDPDHFKRSCFSEGGNRELRRRTDDEAHTPLSPCNLYIYKQTYYGISKVLLPLIQDGSASILPFQKPVDDKPWVLEICPASTLRALGLNGRTYKGRDDSHRANRQLILEAAEGAGPIHIERADVRQAIIGNKGGDALDSVIAAMAVFKTLQKRSWTPRAESEYLIEGYVYH